MKMERDSQPLCTKQYDNWSEYLSAQNNPYNNLDLSRQKNRTRQTDHVCINKWFRRSLQDVRAKKGADVASDHNLVIAKLKLNLKRNQTGLTGSRVKYNINHLKHEVLQELEEDEHTVLLAENERVIENNM